MFTYKMKMKVTVSEFYLLMLEEMIVDIKNKIGKTVKVEELKKGYKYKTLKKYNKEIREATVHIKKPIENKKIVTSYSIGSNGYEMIYNISSIDDDSITIEYIQKDRQNKPGGIIRWFLSWRIKKQFKRYEKEILKKRT